MVQKSHIKKIAIVLPDLRAGGAQRMLLNMAKEYGQQGYDVSLVVLTDAVEFKDEALMLGDVELVVFKNSRAAFAFLKLFWFFVRERPQYILSALSYINVLTILAVRLSLINTYLVVSERAYHSVNAKLTVKRYAIEKLLIRCVYPFANKVVGISQGVAENIRYIGGLAKDKVVTIYNPVVTPQLRASMNEALLTPLNVPDEHKIILACGRLVEVKDYPTLIRAFAALRQSFLNVSLVILGDGVLREALGYLCHELQIEDDVHFVGFVQNPHPYFKRADVFALSSLSEGFGNVIVEALYAGAPVVCTDCPSGPREILDDGQYGQLVTVGDYVAFAAALKEALDTPLPIDKLKERAAVFNVKTICETYLSLAENGFSQ